MTLDMVSHRQFIFYTERQLSLQNYGIAVIEIQPTGKKTAHNISGAPH
jgi:hypothetical protein